MSFGICYFLLHCSLFMYLTGGFCFVLFMVVVVILSKNTLLPIDGHGINFDSLSFRFIFILYQQKRTTCFINFSFSNIVYVCAFLMQTHTHTWQMERCNAIDLFSFSKEGSSFILFTNSTK